MVTKNSLFLHVSLSPSMKLKLQIYCVFRIKKAKEEERRKQEEEALAQVLPRHPITGETAEESIKREKLEAEIERVCAEEEQKKKQRNREMERSDSALIAV